MLLEALVPHKCVGMIRSVWNNCKEAGWILTHNLAIVVKDHSVAIGVSHASEHIAESKFTGSYHFIGPLALRRVAFSGEEIRQLFGQRELVLRDLLLRSLDESRLEILVERCLGIFQISGCLFKIHIFGGEWLVSVCEMDIHLERQGVELLLNELVARIGSLSPVKSIRIEQMMGS